jgi:hypothetical protein
VGGLEGGVIEWWKDEKVQDIELRIAQCIYVPLIEEIVP